MYHCKAIGCTNSVTDPDQDFCLDCQKTQCSESDESWLEINTTRH